MIDGNRESTLHRPVWPSSEVWSSVAAFASLLATTAIDLVFFPRHTLPIIYVLPMLVAGILAPPRVVGVTVLLSAAADLVDVAVARPSMHLWVISLVILLAIGLLSLRFATQRTRITRLNHEVEYRLRAAEQANQRISRFHEAAAALSASLTLREVAQVIAIQCVAAAGSRGGLVALLNATGQELEPIASVGYPDDQIDRVQRFAVTSGDPIGEAVRQAAPVWIESWANQPSQRAGQAARAWDEGCAFACVPLTVGSRTIGVLGLSYSSTRSFSDEERKLIMSLAAMCAQALDRARLYDREHSQRVAAERSADRTARLQQVTATLAEARTPVEVATTTADQIVAALGARAAAVMQLVEHDSVLELVHTTPYTPNSPAAEELRRAWSRFPVTVESPVADAVRNGEPVYLRDGEERLRRYPHLAAVRQITGDGAGVTVPLWVEGRAIGAMNVNFADARTFDDDDREFMLALARQCGIAFERARLRETESRLAALVESSDDAIFSTAIDGTILTWNHGSERTFGYAASDAVGFGVAMLIPPDGIDGLHQWLARFQFGERIDSMDAILIHRDGHAIDVSVRASPIFDSAGQGAGVSVIARDITAHKRSDRARQLLADAGSALASSADYAATLQQVARLVVPNHADWCTVYLVEDEKVVRQVAVAASSASREAILREIARTTRRQTNLPPSLPLDRAIREGRVQLVPEVSDSTIRANTLDHGSLNLVRALGCGSSMIVPLNARGRTLGAMVFSLAQSSHTALLDQSLAEELARRAAFAVDNALLYRDAQRAIQVRDEFLAIAAHELKTPITSLRGFAQLELYRLKRKDTVNPDQLRRTLQVIDAQSQKLASLVSRLLDVIRIDAGHFELHPRAVDLARLVKQLASAVQKSLVRHELSVIANRQIVAWVDPVRVEQLLANLLDNAIKYSPEGGPIEITLETTPFDDACISIRDHGIGIPPEKRDSLFDLYNPSDPVNHRSGMGLGLYISRQIAELHGGKIVAEFPEDGGTRVIVTLPLRLHHITPDLEPLSERADADFEVV